MYLYDNKWFTLKIFDDYRGNMQTFARYFLTVRSSEGKLEGLVVVLSRS